MATVIDVLHCSMGPSHGRQFSVSCAVWRAVMVVPSFLMTAGSALAVLFAGRL